MNTHDIELPAEFRSGNDIPVTVATIKRERMEEILNAAIEADRQVRGEPAKPRPELLELAESVGAVITGKPDGSEPITIVFSVQAWRSFDKALLQQANEPMHLSPIQQQMIHNVAHETGQRSRHKGDYHDQLKDLLESLIPSTQPQQIPNSLAQEAAKHLTSWLDMDSCECEGIGHSCGRTEVKNCRDRLLEAAPEPKEKV